MANEQERASRSTRMSRPSIYVVGPEGSGTTVLWRCVCAHPELQELKAVVAPQPGGPLPTEQVALHLSLPTLRPMRWVMPDELPKGCKVILIRRSPIHTVFSAFRRMYRRIGVAPAWRNYFEAVTLQARYGVVHDSLSVCYEDFVTRPGQVLGLIYGFLGVAQNFLPPIELNDRNDERWKHDPEFARFMDGAFGESKQGIPRIAVDRGRPDEELDSPVGGKGEREAWVFAHGGATYSVVAEAEPLMAHLKQRLPSATPPGDAATPGTRYVVRRRAESAPGVDASGYLVDRNGKLSYASRSADEVVRWMLADIKEIRPLGESEGLTVKAGAVLWREKAILILGQSGSGTSRLVAGLIHAGATPCVDGFAMLDAEGRVRPAYSSRTESNGAAMNTGVEVGLVVSTIYQPDAAWKPRVLRGSRAALPLIDSAVADGHEAARVLRYCAPLASGSVTLQGPRPEAATVAGPILDALDEHLDRDHKS